MIQKKICMLGSSAVGKTSLVRHYVDGIFSEKYLTTLGVKIDKKNITIEDQAFQFMLWDIEGTDQYSGFQPRYMRGAAVLILVTDCTRPQSYLDSLDILRQARKETDAPAILVINKSDLKAEWKLEHQQLFDIEKEFIGTIYTSAKTGESVETLFELIGDYFVTQY